MSFKALITSQVRSTFASYLGDLAVDVTLQQNSIDTYDFATSRAITTEGDTITVKGILTSEEEETIEGKRTVKKLYIPSEDIADFKLYNNFTIEGKFYRVGAFIDDGYVVTVTVGGGNDE